MSSFPCIAALTSRFFSSKAVGYRKAGALTGPQLSYTVATSAPPEIIRLAAVCRRLWTFRSKGRLCFFENQLEPPDRVLQQKSSVTLHPISMAATFPVPKAWCVTMEPGGYITDVEDHPRMRGEEYLERNHMSQKQGSPPRMRGRENVFQALPSHDGGSPPAYAGEEHSIPSKGWMSDGITPAYAGKRGGKLARPVVRLGSPPRMRGRGPCGRLVRQSAGITPAYAGGRVPALAI